MPSSSAETNSLGEWSLIGRAADLARIEQILRPSGASAGIALVGPAGVGKTRLGREGLARAAALGRSVRWIAATDSGREIPLGAFAGLLPAQQSLVQSSEPTSLISSAIHHLRQIGPRLLLGIDDAHLLDPASSVLIHHLVLSGSAQVVLTLRSGAHLPDAMRSLMNDGTIGRLDVLPLSDPLMDDLIDGALGEPIDRSTRRTLRRMCQGNPLHLRQLLQGGLDDGWLVLRDGLWQATAPIQLPPSLSEAVAVRMGAVSEDIGTLLDALSIAEPLSVGLVESLVPPSALEEAEARALVTVDQSDDETLLVRLAHPLYGEARRTMIGSARGRRLRTRLSDAMGDDRFGHSDDLMRRAVIGLESDTPPSLGLLLDALQRAAQHVDVPLAYRLARASMRAGAGFDTQAYLASLAAVIPGGQPEAELDRLAEMAGNDLEVARAAVMRVSHLAWEANDPAAAEATVTQTIAALEDQRAVAHVEAIGTMLLAQRGRPQEAIQVAERLLTDQELGDDAVMLATSGLVSGRAVTGRVDELRQVIDRALADPSALANGAFRARLVGTHVLGLVSAGYLDDAEHAVRSFAADIDQSGPVSAVAACLLGRIELARGRPTRAVSLLLEARAGLLYLGGWRYLTLIALAEAQAMAGTAAEAEDARLELDRHVHPTMLFWEPDRLIADAAVAGRLGARSEALALCEKAVGIAREFGQSASEVVALQQFLRFGSSWGADRLEKLAEVVDGPRVRVAHSHSQALAQSDPVALGVASDQWAECGDTVAAADAAAQSFRVAAQRNGADYRRLAARMQRRAAELLEKCQHAHTPELDAFTRPLPLTEREREVVAMVARGLTNKAIAAHLHVSVRTVEGHVYHASEKLGIARGEFGRLGL